MSAINNAHHATLRSEAPAPALNVGAFWEKTYLPWVKDNKRFSTVRGYEYDWKLYVQSELATKQIDTYTTVEACELRDYLASVKKLNRRSLAHVKSLCSGIFSVAVRKGIIKFNPWREAKASVKVRPSSPRIEYTPEETAAIFNAIQRTDARLFFALCAMLGMRPSEAAAAKWENIVNGVLQVREAAPYGVLGELKTERSKRDLGIIEPVASLVNAYRENLGNPTEGLLFSADGTRPIDHNSFAKYFIAPDARKVCQRWNGCYSGRHGTATALYNLTGDTRSAYQTLGNSKQVADGYMHPSTEQGRAGMLQYEKRLLEAEAMRKGKE